MSPRHLVVVLVSACASQPSGEAPHPSAPEVVSLGGSVLAAPKVEPIFFAGDHASQLLAESFLASLAASSYWDETTSEYGVGALAVVPTIVSTDAPPTTQTALETWLAGKFGTAGWPAAPDPQTIYTVYLPAGVTLTTSDGGESCQAFFGYHDETTDAHGAPIVLALIPRCGGGVRGALDQLTASTSHELVEAATDPRPFTAPAFAELDPDHAIWAYMPGEELGDMCSYESSSYARLVDGYLVQRTWSNAAAAAGHDPCAPADPTATAYLGAAPELPDTAPIQNLEGTTISTPALRLAVGESKTITVDLFADASAPAWSVDAEDIAAMTGAAPALTFKWDRTTGSNGDKLHLTITRVAASSDGAGSEAIIDSRLGQQIVGMWWIYVAS